jgi:hypothetical chaperone protein
VVTSRPALNTKELSAMNSSARYAGLDFGTSNSAIGIWENQQPRLLRLDETRTFMSSTLYVEKSPAFYQLPPHAQTLLQAIEHPADIIFGHPAIQHFLDAPEDGFFIKSPKSFLGARLKPQQLRTYQHIVYLMLDHIKRQAETQLDQTIEQIVIGRPVKFHGTQGDVGNTQALEILTAAAKQAGYRDIEFQFEPIAAALDYERSLDTNVTALIVDIGGGTTDCSMIRVGPDYRMLTNRTESILGYSGDRVGGLDLDIRLAYREFTPLLGKDDRTKTGLPTPATFFWNAVCINNIDAQTQFYAATTGREIEKLLRDMTPDSVLYRLQTVYEEMLSYHLSQSAEATKIALSHDTVTQTALDYVERNLAATVSREQLATALQPELDKFVELMQETVAQSGTTPDVIYVTGGTARSPIVDATIRAAYPNARIVVGDLFGSVVAGLTTWADRCFS